MQVSLAQQQNNHDDNPIPLFSSLYHDQYHHDNYLEENIKEGGIQIKKIEIEGQKGKFVLDDIEKDAEDDGVSLKRNLDVVCSPQISFDSLDIKIDACK